MRQEGTAGGVVRPSKSLWGCRTAHERDTGRRGERGAGTVLVLGLGMVLLVGFTLIVLLVQAGTLASRAAAAADLGALAAADAARGLRDGDPCALASEVVRRHGAVLDDCTLSGPYAEVADVRTRVDGVLGLARATGHARAGPPP